MMDSVVKVFCVHAEPNFSQPWQRKRQAASTSSGFAIEGRRILTNAHSVDYAAQVREFKLSSFKSPPSRGRVGVGSRGRPRGWGSAAAAALSFSQPPSSLSPLLPSRSKCAAAATTPSSWPASWPSAPSATSRSWRSTTNPFGAGRARRPRSRLARRRGCRTTSRWWGTPLAATRSRSRPASRPGSRSGRGEREEGRQASASAAPPLAPPRSSLNPTLFQVISYVHGAAELLGLQTSSAINGGNSGGPCFNQAGECVGIAFQSMAGSDAENIG